MVSKLIGFPAVGIKLISISGDLLHEYASLELLLSQDPSCEEQGLVTVGCVLTQMQPVGKKEGEEGAANWFGSKAGMLLTERVRYQDRHGRNPDRSPIESPVVIRSRNPDQSLQKHIKNLITTSFAPGLSPLIDMGVNAAFHNAAPSHSASPTQAFLYEDAVHNAFADLSLCQVWAYSMQPSGLKAAAAEYSFLADDILNMNPILCSVLWRLLPSWQNKGPVLEVLFLATSKDVREQGWANELVEELQETATTMGCSAIAVAAVPIQGKFFWTQRCGFEVVVPLKNKSNGEQKTLKADESKEIVIDDLFDEPVNDLGQFLLQNMLLFTDTPLVAKILSKESQSASQNKEQKVDVGFSKVEHKDTLPLADHSDRWCCPRRRA